GAYGYDAKDDALRVTTAPLKAPHAERMTFAFDDVSDAGTTLSLHWAGLKASLKVAAEFVETGKANIARGLPNIKAGDPYAWLGAARFYWMNAAAGAAGDADRAQALEWVDKSISVKPLFVNLWAKAQWLAASKRTAEALEAGKFARDAAAQDPGTAAQVPEIEKTMKGWK